MFEAVGACVLFACSQGSSGEASAPDAGTSATLGASCSADDQCSSGEGCFYALDGGCHAGGNCLERPSENRKCASAFLCACDGTFPEFCSAPEETSPKPMTGKPASFDPGGNPVCQ